MHVIYERSDKTITKKGEIESASRPPSGFGGLNDKPIKELTLFTKCMSRKLI